LSEEITEYLKIVNLLSEATIKFRVFT